MKNAPGACAARGEPTRRETLATAHQRTGLCHTPDPDAKYPALNSFRPSQHVTKIVVVEAHSVERHLLF